MFIVSAIAGTIAAFLWGSGDLLAKLYIPRWGGWRPWVLWSQIFGFLAFLGFFAAINYSLPPLSYALLLRLLCLGLIGLGGYFFFFIAISQARLSIVSPILASWAAISFILSAFFLPQLPLVSWGMLVLILIGVILSSLHPASSPESHGSREKLGILFALGSGLCWGIFNFFVKFLAEQSDPYLPVFAIKAWGALFGLPLVMRKRYPVPACRARDLGFFALPLYALIDSVAYIIYTHGTIAGFVPITAAFASLFSLFAVLFGVIILKERLSRLQIVGIAFIIAASFGLFYFSADGL